MFLDVVGSTTLAQHLDPEAISAVMEDALARGTAVVQAHRGKVLQYAGDNILAAFGADESREDDAERAVHCGLALLALGKQLGAEVLAAHGHHGFNVRVGVHTGAVLLGGGVDQDGSIRGIAVNIATRMEQTAPAGALRISHDTYAQVRGLFDVDAQEPLVVKGVDTPVQSYLVKAAKPRNFRIGTRGIEGVTTEMIGRDAELEQLQVAFKRVFDGSPVVLQLEDLHWADTESLDFLNYLAEVNRDVPLLVLSFTRPTLFERRTDWSSTDGLHQRIDLTPLDKTGSRMLANELLKKLPEVPAALRELVTSSAEGNPLYMEELVKMLIDQGAIRAGSGSSEAWSVNAERLLVTQVPATLTGVLQARLDGLPPAEKRALQQASVVGTVFWDQALAAIEAPSAELLPALVQRELTLPRTHAALDGLREYAFRHQVLHQVTYDTVLKRHKREGHAKVAQWLAALTEQGSPRAGDFLDIGPSTSSRPAMRPTRPSSTPARPSKRGSASLTIAYWRMWGAR